MKRLFSILILLCWQTIAMATLSVQIDPSTASMDDTIHLTLTLDGPSSAGVPDVTPLEKDFTIIGTEHSTSYTASNGVAKSESQWIVLLTAKRPGVITIPAIQLGQQYSRPGQVNITTSAQATAADNPAKPTEDDAVMLHADVSQSAPFINEQVIYTVKLYSRKPLMNAAYQPPHVEDALLIPLGDGRRYQTTMNGMEYAVDEQQYAIYSQKSGKVEIIPPAFNAVVYGAVPRRIHVSGPATSLNIKPIPAKNANQQWLPAKRIILTEVYNPALANVAKGDAVVRTITLQAEGMPAELLPTLEFTDNEQFSVYPEKSETKNTLRQQELIGISTIKVTYVLTQSGQMSIPSIKLPWFNTITGSQDIATLPARQITVTGAPTAAPEQAHQTITTPQPVKTAPNNQTHQLAWWVAAAFAMAWLMTLVLWWWFRHRRVETKHTVRSALTRLRTTCATNNPVETHLALLNWGSMQWPEATLFNLSQLNNLIHDIALKQQINLLSQALYSQKRQSTWRGDELWRAVKGYRPLKSSNKSKRNDLPPINPDVEPLIL